MKIIKTIFGVIVSAAAILTAIFIFACCYSVLQMWYFEPKTVSGIDYYKDNAYSDFSYGEIAETVLPEYEEVCKLGEISFVYSDLSHKNSLFHRYYSSYVLDIVFTNQEDYDAHKQAVEINEWEAEEEQYQIYSIKKDQEESEAAPFIAFNDHKKAVRYLIFVGKDAANVGFRPLMMWNTDLEWT